MPGKQWTLHGLVALAGRNARGEQADQGPRIDGGWKKGCLVG
jgi:hypothetical protein